MAQATAAKVVPLNDVRGKTEQRVARVLKALRTSKGPLSYEDLQAKTSSTYDSLLYILATLCEVGMVERIEQPEGPGRPRVMFQWIAPRGRAQDLGS